MLWFVQDLVERDKLTLLGLWQIKLENTLRCTRTIQEFDVQCEHEKEYNLQCVRSCAGFVSPNTTLYRPNTTL